MIYTFIKLQTMNTLKFIVCNINTVLPADINEMIFKKVQENAAESIQRMYFLRVNINLDAFLIFSRISRWGGANPDEIHFINKTIAFYAARIRYSFIQEPGTWIVVLIDIINKCHYFTEFHINNVYFIINNVEKSNWIFKQTGVAWWENI
jgi:hypothetical protein